MRLKSERLFMFLMTFPIFRKFPLIRRIADKNRVKARQRIDVIKGYVDLHKETYDPDHCRDFVDAFLAEIERNKEDKSTYYTDEQLHWILTDLFLAGTDTTATTVYWALVFLSAYPDCQAKVYREVESVLGSDGLPKYGLKATLPYLQAVIQETLRMRPPFPISITHKATEDVDLLGYTLPKGTPVAANLWGVQNDPNIWENPEEFRPERHINSKGEFVKSDRVIPFSVGLRHCLGKQLAQMSLYIFMARLIQHFSFSFPHDQPNPDLRGSSLFVLSPIGIKLTYKVR